MPVRCRILLLCLVLLGCQPRREAVPDWVASAPAEAVMALSFRTDWALDGARFQTLLAGFPPADRALEDFLNRARIDFRQESGRITLYLLDPSAGQPGAFLIQLGEFRHPGKPQVAIADAFPSEGSVAMDNRALPLYVVLDVKPCRIRAMVDGEGRVWLGDVSALARVGGMGWRPRNPLAASARWLSPTMVAQGFVRTGLLLRSTPGRFPDEWARDLPRGIEAMSWGVTPGAAPGTMDAFELALAGSHEGVSRMAPWLQRYLAAATALPGMPVPNPEMLQEKRRVGLRCQLSRAELDLATANLGLPRMSWR